MSYRNPTQNVDTQSGQHFRNMQAQIAQAGQIAIGGIQKRQAEEQAAIYKQEKEQAKQQAKKQEDLNKLKAIYEEDEYKLVKEIDSGILNIKGRAKNSDLQIESALLEHVDGLSDLMVGLRQGTITGREEIAKAKSRIQEIYGLPKRIRSSLENLYGLLVDFDDKIKNMGTMGGADPNKKYLNHYKAIGVLGDKIKGSRKLTIQENEAGKLEVGVLVNVEGKEVFYSEDTLSKFMESETGGIATIPDESKRMEEIANRMFFNDVNGKKQFKKEYIGEEVLRQSLPSGKKMMYYNGINKTAMKNAIYAEALANVNSMSNDSLESFAGFVNVKFEGENLEDVKKLVADKYTDLVVKKFEGMEFNKTIEKIEEPKAPKPPTQSELDRQRKIKEQETLAKEIKKEINAIDSKLFSLENYEQGEKLIKSLAKGSLAGQISIKPVVDGLTKDYTGIEVTGVGTNKKEAFIPYGTSPKEVKNILIQMATPQRVTFDEEPSEENKQENNDLLNNEWGDKMQVKVGTFG